MIDKRKEWEKDMRQKYPIYSGIYGLPAKNVVMMDIDDVYSEILKAREECANELDKIERYIAYDLPEEYICAPDINKLAEHWRK